MVKVITGVRRCGKPYLLFQLFKRLLLKERISAEFLCKDHQNLLLLRQGNSILRWKFFRRECLLFHPDWRTSKLVFRRMLAGIFGFVICSCSNLKAALPCSKGR